MRSTFVIRLALLLSLSGCSILFTRGPRNSQPAVAGQMAAAPSCTSSMTWPAVDGIVAGLLTIALISSISQDNNSMTSDDPDDDALASGFILAGAAGVSALIGHQRVSKCRKVTETYTAQYYGQPQPQYAHPQQYPQQPQYQYPQQYPAQGYPAPPQYPTPPAQPYAPTQPGVPGVQPPQQPAVIVPPGRQPVGPQPPPIAKQPPAPRAPPRPAPKAPDVVLGTEGDVCTNQTECATGFACSGNVCLKAK